MKKYSIGFIVIEIAVLLVISIIPTAFVAWQQYRILNNQR